MAGMPTNDKCKLFAVRSQPSNSLTKPPSFIDLTLNVVVTAIAREMIAYIWAISREVVLPVVDVKLRLARMPA